MENLQLKSFRLHTVVLIVLLAIEYLFGMYVDLFVSFPENAGKEQLWSFAWSQPLLALHIIVSILLLVGAVVVHVKAHKINNRILIISSGIGLISIFAASFTGAKFVSSQTDAYSYGMTIVFIVALLSYVWSLYSSSKIVV